MNTVYVEYDGGLNAALDESINKAASCNIDDSFEKITVNVNCDSGCCIFEPYTRDLAFYYKSAQEALKAAAKMRELDGVRVKTKIED